MVDQCTSDLEECQLLHSGSIDSDKKYSAEVNKLQGEYI